MALFIADEPTLIDKARRWLLGQCAGTIDATTRITVAGHRGDGRRDAQSAMDISTERATTVAVLLRELKVPVKKIAQLIGDGDTQPIIAPTTDPAGPGSAGSAELSGVSAAEPDKFQHQVHPTPAPRPAVHPPSSPMTHADVRSATVSDVRSASVSGLGWCSDGWYSASRV